MLELFFRPFAFLLAIALAACGGSEPDDKSAGQPAAPAAMDLRYGGHPRQDAQLLVPDTGAAAKGLVIWIHGGGWAFGSRETQGPLVEPLQAAGYAVLNVNYRLVPDGVWPNSVNDIYTILKALHQVEACEDCTPKIVWAQAAAYAQQALHVAGGSAGGYLALAASAQYAKDHLFHRIRCVHNIAGPTDLRGYAELPGLLQQLVKDYADGDVSADKLTRMSPLAELHQGNTGYLNPSIRWNSAIVAEDDIVPSDQVRAFHEVLMNHGMRSTHYDMVADHPEGHRFSLEQFVETLDSMVTNCL